MQAQAPGPQPFLCQLPAAVVSKGDARRKVNIAVVLYYALPDTSSQGPTDFLTPILIVSSMLSTKKSCDTKLRFLVQVLNLDCEIKVPKRCGKRSQTRVSKKNVHPEQIKNFEDTQSSSGWGSAEVTLPRLPFQGYERHILH